VTYFLVLILEQVTSMLLLKSNEVTMLSTPLTLFTWLLGQVLNNSYLRQTLFGFG